MICDVSINTNYVYAYDQRLAGKDFNAMCSFRLLHHLGERQLLKKGSGPVPNQLFMCMDNNVGQNKSQVVFMFFALLSLTAYPEGVTLSFLTSGHSHFILDRVTGNMKQALKSKNIFCPEELLKTINEVKNVEAKFLDHRDKKVYMYTGWDKLLYEHFTEIPQLSKIGGYTSCFFFISKMGFYQYGSPYKKMCAMFTNMLLVQQEDVLRRTFRSMLHHYNQNCLKMTKHSWMQLWTTFYLKQNQNLSIFHNILE